MVTQKTNKNMTLSFLAMVLAVVVFATVGAHIVKSRSAGLIDVMAPPIQIDQWITSPPPDLKDRVYVLEFWATWCQPCVQSIPHMVKLASKYKSKDVSFISISVDRSLEPVIKMVRDKGMNYHIGMDNGLAKKYFVRSIPSTFIVDRSGRIVWRGHPMSHDFESAIVNALNASLSAPGAK